MAALGWLVGIAIAGCDWPVGPTVVYSERIGNVGHGYRKRSLTVSHDQRRLAWVQADADQCRVVVDRQKSAPLAICIDPRFSADGATVAYWAVPEASDPPLGHLYVDGKQQPVAAGQDGVVAFSKHGGGWVAIAPAYDPAIRPGDEPAPEATPADTTGRDAADGAATEPSKPRRNLVAFGPHGTLGQHRETSSPAISPDGAHNAYIARDDDGSTRLIVDGAVARTFGKPEVQYLPVLKKAVDNPAKSLDPEYAVQYLADGSLVTIVLAEQGYTVFHGDEVWASYPAVQIPKTGFEVIDPTLLSKRTIVAGSLVAAANAPVACWWERLEGEVDHWRVACNGQPIDDQLCDFYSGEAPIAVAADGRSAGYVCRDNPPLDATGLPSGPAPIWAVIRGERIGPHPFLWAIDLTPDGRHYAFVAADSVDSTWFYIVDGKRYDGPWREAFPPKLSPDGSSVVWAAGREEEDRRVDLVVDGELVARADIVMAPPLFQGNHKVQWAVRRGKSVRRIVVCSRWSPLELLRPLVCW